VAAPSPESRIREADFRRLQRLIEDVAGIFVPHAGLLVQRLGKRLRELRVASFQEYCERLVGDADERMRMVECLCTHETRFFREPRQLHFLETVQCPAWLEQADAARRPRSLRVWSAGCATGEEPYSIAMTLRARLPTWSIGVVGTDVSRSALERAQNATWPVRRASEIPERYLLRFMLCGAGCKRGQMRASDELRALVRTAYLNLNDAAYALGDPFDAIFCRNVLIYFREEVRARVLARLLAHLAPGGILFLGHSEGLGSQSLGLRPVGPIVYARDGDGRGERSGDGEAR